MADSTTQTPYARDLQRQNDRLIDKLLRRAYGPELLQQDSVGFIEERGLSAEFLSCVEARSGAAPAPAADDAPTP